MHVPTASTPPTKTRSNWQLNMKYTELILWNVPEAALIGSNLLPWYLPTEHSHGGIPILEYCEVSGILKAPSLFSLRGYVDTVTRIFLRVP